MSLLLLASCGNCALSSVHEVGSAAQQSTIICCTSQQCTDQPRVMTIHTPTCPSARAAQDLSLKDALRGALENFLQSPLSYCVPGADSEAPAHTARRTVFSCSGASGVHRHGSLGRCRAPAAAHMQPLLSLGCCISATAWRGSWTLHTRCMLLCMRAHGEPHLPQGERLQRAQLAHALHQLHRQLVLRLRSVAQHNQLVLPCRQLRPAQGWEGDYYSFPVSPCSRRPFQLGTELRLLTDMMTLLNTRRQNLPLAVAGEWRCCAAWDAALMAAALSNTQATTHSSCHCPS